MSELASGTVLKSESGSYVKVVKELGRGGQGIVYMVDIGGVGKALKWYHETAIKDKAKFIENLSNNIKNHSPSHAFLWPLDLVFSNQHNSFGYIMDLRPKEYVKMSQFLLFQKFDSFRARVDAMICMVNGFRILHNLGYSYQDLNDGNFFINPHNGEVLICDNDNVASEGFSSGVLGKNRYMAPEIVTGDKMPDKATDRFSMAVLLFMLLCKSHPLEGEGTMAPCITPEVEFEIYGTNPVFIYDPRNDSNRPIRGVQDNTIKMWSVLPDYVRETFIKAFTKESMTFSKDKQAYDGPRIIEREWLEVLIRLRNSIVPCSCGNEEFIKEKNAVCTNCGRKLPIVSYIKTSHGFIPAYPKNRVTKMNIENCDDLQALTVIAEVEATAGRENDPFGYEIRNCSKEVWRCITSSGQMRTLQPGEVMPAKPGIKVNTTTGSFEIFD